MKDTDLVNMLFCTHVISHVCVYMRDIDIYIVSNGDTFFNICTYIDIDKNGLHLQGLYYSMSKLLENSISHS